MANVWRRPIIRRLALELQRLVLEELLQPVKPSLAAVARLLEAAERRVHVEGAAVDVDLPGADAPRDALRARLVLGPNRAGEAVDGVVGDAHRFVLILVGNDREHRPEDLFLSDGHAVFDFAEYGGTHVVAAWRHALGRLGAARDQLRALGLSLLDVVTNPLELRLRAQRPELRRLRQRTADGEALRHLGSELGCLLVLR